MPAIRVIVVAVDRRPISNDRPLPFRGLPRSGTQVFAKRIAARTLCREQEKERRTPIDLSNAGNLPFRASVTVLISVEEDDR